MTNADIPGGGPGYFLAHFVLALVISGIGPSLALAVICLIDIWRKRHGGDRT